ncbi:MAG: hypothetical protein EAX95_16110, partial [Candidatus Thorarchaeota archaeon]|nr:hypothetical protein [Candidatus Thorarchaeota archaeon]
MGDSQFYKQVLCFVYITLIVLFTVPLQVGLEASLGVSDGLQLDVANSSSSTLPPAVMGASMVYDSESDRMILFGGISESILSNQTWSYDFNSNTWTNLTPAVSPPPISGHQLVYDSESDLIVLVGGMIMNNQMEQVANTETWSYDLNSNTWTNLSSSPCADDYFRLGSTYDSVEDLVVVHMSEYEMATWTYDVNSDTWTNMTTETCPSPRVLFKMVYDDRAQVSLLHSGGHALLGYSDTWAYNCSSNNWTLLEVPSYPEFGLPFAMSYDSSAERVIKYSSAGTWAFSSEARIWYDMNSTTGIPPISFESYAPFCMAYDSESDRTVLFNVVDGNAATWAYSYQDNSWMNMAWLEDGVFSFIAYGDTRGDGEEAVSPLNEDIVELFCQHDPEFVIHTGDMVRSGAEAYQWEAFNDTIWPLWLLGTPMYGAPGNHE